MTAAEIQVEHSIELEVMMNGKKTTLLSGIDAAGISSICLDGESVTFSIAGSVRFDFKSILTGCRSHGVLA